MTTRTEALIEREHDQMKRLERVIDVLYALVIWRAVTLLPHPTGEEVEAAGGLLRAMLPYANNFALVLVGVALPPDQALLSARARSPGRGTDRARTPRDS